MDRDDKEEKRIDFLLSTSNLCFVVSGVLFVLMAFNAGRIRNLLACIALFGSAFGGGFFALCGIKIWESARLELDFDAKLFKEFKFLRRVWNKLKIFLAIAVIIFLLSFLTALGII